MWGGRSMWIPVLGHLQWLVHIGRQNGQQVVNAANKKCS